MTLHEAYVHVQQGLQNIAAFVYKNVETTELDYFWLHSTNTFIKLAVPNIDDDIPNEGYEVVQASLDDLRVLFVNDTAISLGAEATVAGYTFRAGSLPTNYRHLLNDRTIVSPVNCTTTETRVVPNRLTKHSGLFNVLENTLHKTAIGSPVSKIHGNTITVYNSYKGVKQFNIDSVYIDYLRKPTAYTYAVNSNTTLEFPDDVCFKIIKTTLLYMAKVAEQNPNKIQFLTRD